MTIPEDHFDHLARLLELEAEAEREQAARGLSGDERALKGLVVREEDAGLGGRLLITLGYRDRTRALPPTRLQPGSPVFLRAPGAAEPIALRGVVFARSTDTLRVAIEWNEDGIPDVETWQVELAADELARRRQIAALQAARAARRGRLAELREILLGRSTPAFHAVKPWSPLDSGLNPSQCEAITHALHARDLAIIHGPPGTGKTTTIVELIRQAVRRGERVLVCAPSNLAVDNVLEKLVAAGEPALRLGHPARVSEALREHTLDERVERHDDARQARRFHKEAHALLRQAGRWTRAKPDPGERGRLRREARALFEDARHREEQAVQRVLDEARIVCATLTGLNPEILGEREFDLAVLDEACQATEPAAWLALGRARRVVLAGDHCQLPPTILSDEAQRRGLGISLMERLVQMHGPAVTRRLRTQYRMHEAIAGFSSAEFYAGDLVADESVRRHRLGDLPGISPGVLTDDPVRFIDTAGAGFEEELDEESRRNPAEAELAARLVQALLASGLTAEQVAVIAPYSAQVKRLRELLDLPGLEIDSVDGFQGREKEAVVLSMVRSNVEGDLGFLVDVRRTNVAMTRARRKLVVIGDSATLAHHPFYERMLSYFESIGAHGSVWEE